MKKTIRTVFRLAWNLLCAALDTQPQPPTRALLIGTWCTAEGTVVCRFRANGTMTYRGQQCRYTVDEKDRLVLLWSSGETTVLLRDAGELSASYSVTRRCLLLFGEHLTWNKLQES